MPDAVDDAAAVVAHQHRAVRPLRESAGPGEMALVAFKIEAGNEVLKGFGFAVLEAQSHDLVAAWLAAVPGAVQRHQGVAVEALGELLRGGKEHRHRRAV